MAQTEPSSVEKISIKDANEIISNDTENFKPDFTIRSADHLQNEIEEMLVDCPVREEMRTCTFIVKNAFEHIQEKMDLSDYIMIYTGSSIKGMLYRSDIGVMYCSNQFVVVENSDQTPSDHK